MTETILIQDLRQRVRIGVLDHEKLAPQEIRVSVEIRMVPGYAGMVAETGRYFSYAEPVAFLQEIADSGEHIELVETVAERLAAFILGSDLVASVRVEVLKTEIFDHVGGVGIAIERERAGAGAKTV